MPKMLKKLNYIYKHFGGEVPQENKLIEEIAEYQESGETEELVDMWVLLTQRYLNSKSFRIIADYKIDRTIERIDSKYYENKGATL